MAKLTVIDDDLELADDLAQALRGAGHKVSVLNSTQGAIEALEADPPDLLVLDVMFPENDAGGFELARKIREREIIQTLPIILLTAVNQEFPMDFSPADIDPEWMPVQHFMDKPVNIGSLLEKVDALLE